jgi:hypothetical protein
MFINEPLAEVEIGVFEPIYVPFYCKRAYNRMWW